MIKSKKSNIKSIVYHNKKYIFHDAHHTKEYAEINAKGLRTIPCPWQESRVCGAIVVDLGERAEPRRYGVFITKGGPWKKGGSVWLYDFQKSMLRGTIKRMKKESQKIQEIRANLNKKDIIKYYDTLNTCDAKEKAIAEILDDRKKQAYKDAERNRLNFERTGRHP